MDKTLHRALEAARLIREHMEAGANPPFNDPVKNVEWLLYYHNEALSALGQQSARVMELEAENAALRRERDTLAAFAETENCKPAPIVNTRFSEVD